MRYDHFHEVHQAFREHHFYLGTHVYYTFHTRCEKNHHTLILIHLFWRTKADCVTEIINWYEVPAEYTARLVIVSESWGLPIVISNPSRSSHYTDILKRSCESILENGKRVFVTVLCSTLMTLTPQVLHVLNIQWKDATWSHQYYPMAAVSDDLQSELFLLLHAEGQQIKFWTSSFRISSREQQKVSKR